MATGTITGVPVPPPPEGPTRPIPERVLAASPRWLLGLATRFIARLPPSSRLRRRVLQTGMSRAWGAANRDDWWFTLPMYERDSEIVVAPEFRTIGLADFYRGAGGSKELADAWREEISDMRWDPELLIDLGDCWVLRARMSGSGRSSGARVDQTWGSVYRVSSQGRIVRQNIYWTWAEALAAAGLDQGD